MPLKRMNIQTAVWWPHKKYTHQKKKYLQLRRSREDFEIRVMTFFSTKTEDQLKHSQRRWPNTECIWKWQAVPLPGHPGLWRTDKSSRHSLDFLVTEGGLNSEARGRVELEWCFASNACNSTEAARPTRGLLKQQWEKWRVWNRISHPFKTLHLVHLQISSTPGSLPLGPGTVCSLHLGHLTLFLSSPTLLHPSNSSLQIDHFLR